MSVEELGAVLTEIETAHTQYEADGDTKAFCAVLRATSSKLKSLMQPGTLSEARDISFLSKFIDEWVNSCAPHYCSPPEDKVVAISWKLPLQITLSRRFLALRKQHHLHETVLARQRDLAHPIAELLGVTREELEEVLDEFLSNLKSKIQFKARWNL